MIANKIKKVREWRNLSQAYMAEQLKVSQQTYSRLERGDISLHLDRLEEIAQILDLSIQELLAIDEQTVFNNINSQHINNINYQTLSENERRLYEARIKHLEEEVIFLRQQLSK